MATDTRLGLDYLNGLIMKTILSTFIIVLFFLSAYSQPAPDFTVTDSDGTEWNLHEQLGLGKTVVLDFFFVDCVPCQSQSPEVSAMYQDYLTAGYDVLVLGISNRDSDGEVELFDQTYGITYPTAGEDGGGDTVTTLYQSWFPFFSWPSYGVVCPDTIINWGIFPTVPNVPELRSAVDECLGIASVGEENRISDFIMIEQDQIHIKSEKIREIRMTDLSGRELYSASENLVGKNVQIPTIGISILSIELLSHQIIHLKLYR